MSSTDEIIRKAILVSLVGTALVHRDFVWMAIQSHGLVEKALRCSHVPLCRQQEVDGLAMLVDGAVEVFPDALDLDVRLIHAPVAADRALVLSGHLLDERQKTNRPPVDRRMVDRNAALLHHFLEVPIAQRVGCIPPDANQDHIDRKAHPFEVEYVDSSGFGTAVYPTGPPRSLMRQPPHVHMKVLPAPHLGAPNATSRNLLASNLRGCKMVSVVLI